MSHRAQQKAEARAAREAAERAEAVRAERRRRLSIFGGVIAFAAVVLVVVLLAGGSSDDKGSAKVPERVALFDGIPQEGQWLGDPDAPVVVEEYADLQCPYCAQFATTNLPPIVEDFVKPGEARLRLRLVSILGQDSKRAAQVGQAAMQQNRGWQFAEAFYVSQRPENSGYVDDEFMRARAKEAGVDADQALSASKSPEVTKALDENAKDFDEHKLGGTPSFRVGPADGPMKSVEIDDLPKAIQDAYDQATKGGASASD